MVGSPASSARSGNSVTAYVAGEVGDVTPIQTATNIAGATLSVGGEVFHIAITPDGKTVYASDYNLNSVIPIQTATNTAGPHGGSR